MLNIKSQFKHTDNQIVLDNSLVYDLLAYYEKSEIIPKERAVLYKNTDAQSGEYGFKTALWINLYDSQPSTIQLTEFNGLWLIEHQNNKVQVLASQEHSTQKSIGGRVIRNLDILNANAQWVSDLAEHLSLIQCKYAGNALNNKMNAHQTQTDILLYEIELDLLTTAIQAFVNEIDEKVIYLMQKEGTGNNVIYNHYISASSEHQRNRLQAADCYPWFTRLLRGNYKLRQAVDQGKPLSTELSNFYHVKSRTIKQFKQIIQPSFLSASKASLVKSLDKFTVDYFPDTEDDYVAFNSVSESLILLSDILQVTPIKMAKPFKGGWAAGIKTLEIQLNHSLDFEPVFNMMQASFYYGVMPVLYGTPLEGKTQPPDNWYKAWFSAYGLKRLFEMANKWELLYGEFCLKRLDLQYENQDSPAILIWPSLLNANYTQGSYRIVELTSQHDLEIEGRKLEHCVAIYGPDCLISGSYIYSVRDRSGNSLSTFEINFFDDKPELVQHYSLLDETPTLEQQICVMNFVNTVLSSVSKEQREKIEECRHIIWQKIKGQSNFPDEQEEPLTPQEIETLQQMVAFTHPSGMDTEGILRFFDMSDILSVRKQTSLNEIDDILNGN